MQIRNVYGIDLGTSTVKIYDLKKDTITKEKNMIAIRNREQVIAAIRTLVDEGVYPQTLWESTRG